MTVHFAAVQSRTTTSALSMDPSIWEDADSALPPELGVACLHVWRVALDSPQRIDLPLSAAERTRTNGFRRILDANRYANARSALRRLLAAYSGLDAHEFHILEGNGRKPVAVDVPELRFNVTHAGNLCLIAVARRRDVGIDVELERDIPDGLALAERHFTPLERDEVRYGAGTFLTCWTRKEAVLKLRGTGLHDRLATLDVGAAPTIRTYDGAIVVSFMPQPGAVAAIAYDAGVTSIRYLDFSG